MQTRFATTTLALLRASLGDDVACLASDAERALAAPLPLDPAHLEQVSFLGVGWTYGLASEAALKLREAAQFWAESYLAMEYRHGPISIAAPGPGGMALRAAAARPRRPDRRDRRDARAHRRPRPARGAGAGAAVRGRHGGGPRPRPRPAAGAHPLGHPARHGGDAMKRVHILGVAALVLAAVALGVVAAACGSSPTSSGSSASPGGSGTVTLWHGYTDVERTATDAFAVKYNATDPAWKVDAVFSGNSDYGLQKLLTALAAGKAPDMMYQYGSSLANLSRSPKIVTIGDLIAQSPDFNWDDFYRSRTPRVHGERRGQGPSGAGRQPLARLQQGALRQGRRRLSDGGLDLGRLPQCRRQAHRSGGQAVRLGLRERRRRGHRVALPRGALAGRRRPAERRQHAGGVQLAVRPRRP